ncbi:MAG TPA: Crp/Fnr family transcriptional regulator [Gammaproteobacteria bacterium]|nr:Crp/Fnr family transcriptional regulator [Gammaproteobacteria bacterium]
MTGDQKALLRELRRHYLFTTLTELQWSRIAACTRVQSFSERQLVFGQGDPAKEFFVLDAGVVKLYRVSAEGQEKIMRLIRPGMSFAESVMFMDEPRYPVHAQGVEPGVLVAIESAAYLDVLRESFEACRIVMAQMTQRIQAHWDEIEALTLQNSRYRVVSYMLGLVPEGTAGSARITLPSRKSLIASQVAATPETLSRILHALGEEGLIESHDYTIWIPSLTALRKSLY